MPPVWEGHPLQNTDQIAFLVRESKLFNLGSLTQRRHWEKVEKMLLLLSRVAELSSWLLPIVDIHFVAFFLATILKGHASGCINDQNKVQKIFHPECISYFQTSLTRDIDRGSATGHSSRCIINTQGSEPVMPTSTQSSNVFLPQRLVSIRAVRRSAQHEWHHLCYNRNSMHIGSRRTHRQRSIRMSNRYPKFQRSLLSNWLCSREILGHPLYLILQHVQEWC